MPRAHFNYRGRIAWVTGASTGIGRACAEEFLRLGANVAVSARGEEGLREIERAHGSGRVLVLPMDVTSPEANRASAESIAERWGRVDVALLNAGTCEYVSADRFDASIFERLFRTNVVGMANGIEAALPLLRKSDAPRLAGMSSSAAYCPLPRAEAYGATKAAIRHMLATLRLTLAADGIAVTTVCPGFVRTPLTAKNGFPMPMLMEAGAAARIIARGIAAGRAEIFFPWLFCAALKALAFLPPGVRGRMMGRLMRA